jgi:proline iminopeptidase
VVPFPILLLKCRGILLAVLTGMASCSGKHQATATEGNLAGAGGIRLFYQVVGIGPDTIVVVHGGPGAGINSIRPDVEELSRDHVLIFYDQRGSGRSELPDTTLLAPKDFVRDLEAVRDHFRLATMKVIAQSFGAIIVAQYATIYPERIARMVFLGATGPSRKQAAPFYRAHMYEGDTATAHQLFTAVGSLMEGTATDPEATCWRVDSLTKKMTSARGEFVGWKGSHCAMPAAAIRYSFRYTERLGPEGFGAWDFTRSLHHVRAPLLVVDGERDVSGLSMERAWVSALPNAKLLVIRGAGRAVAAERPEAVFPAIDTFMVGSWPSAAMTPR